MRILITGITGTIGTELTKNLKKDCEIVGISRDELKQSRFPYKNDVELYLGDVRDGDPLVMASRGCDIIIHTAALKHVDIMEKNPNECIQTNIYGTENVLKAQAVNDVSRVVLLSTDKAVYPINTYGHCKAIAEKLTLNWNSNNCVVRYGNVVNSRGSVISLFKEQLKNGGYVRITDPKMTRFWIKIQDAAKLVENVAFHGQPGTHVPNMKASSVKLMADAILSEMQHGDYTAAFDVVGMRPGEKINECLKTRYENVFGNSSNFDVYSDRADQFTLEELRDLVRGEI